METGTEEDAADRMREAAISSAASLRPNFKSKELTEVQLSKFRELHRRRLQIKAKSKVHKKDKGSGDGKGKSRKTAMEGHGLKDHEPSESYGDSSSHPLSDKRVGMEEKQDNYLATKRQQKLFWGLDTKERWERKSNM